MTADARITQSIDASPVADIRVPWNAGWTGEERFELRPCRWADGQLALWQPHQPGEGKPIFAQPHSVRQRRSIAEMRCTVCGERTDPSDRWWFGLGNFIGDWWMTNEAPVHRRCADHAFTVCPHLRNRGVEPVPMPTGFTVLMSKVGGPEFERKFGIETRGRKVIGALKLAWPRSAVRVGM